MMTNIIHINRSTLGVINNFLRVVTQSMYVDIDIYVKYLPLPTFL